MLFAQSTLSVPYIHIKLRGTFKAQSKLSTPHLLISRVSTKLNLLRNYFLSELELQIPLNLKTTRLENFQTLNNVCSRLDKLLQQTTLVSMMLFGLVHEFPSVFNTKLERLTSACCQHRISSGKRHARYLGK